MGIPLVGPDGKRYVLDNEANLAAAEAEGYRAITADAPETFGEQAKGAVVGAVETLEAGAQALVRGFAPGLTGALLGGEKGADESDRHFARRKFEAEEQTRLRKESPLVSGAAELGGMLASPLSKLSGGISAGIGASTALGRIGAGVVGGAAEGALFGAGNAVDESALGATELTAEKLIAGTGLGALLGGAGGGVGHAIGEAAKVAIPAAQRLAGKVDLADFANERWLKASGGIQSDIKKIPLAEREAVAGVMRKHLGLGELDDALVAVGKEREALSLKAMDAAGLPGSKLAHGMAKDDAEAALEGMFKDAAGRKQSVIDAVESAGAKPDLAIMGKRIGDLWDSLEPLEQKAIKGDVEDALSALEKYSQKSSGFKSLDKMRQNLDSKAKWDNNVGQAFVADSRRKLANVIREEVDSQLAQHVGPNMAKAFLDAKRELSLLFAAEKALGRKTSTGSDAIAAILEKAGVKSPELSAIGHADALLRHGVDRKVGNRWVSASDYLGGLGAAVLGGGGVGALMGLPAAIGHKLIREKGSAVVAKLADRIQQSPSLKIAAQSFTQKATKAAPYLGQYAPILAQAARRGPAFALATHMVFAQGNADYAEKAQSAGFLPETPEETAFSSAKADGLVGVAAALKETDEAINKGMAKVFKGSDAARTPNVTSSQDFGTKRMRRAEGRHEKRMDEVAQLAANPEALLERVTANLEGLGDHAPGVSAATSALAHRAVTYLAGQIQKPVKPGPLAPEWRFNQTELFVFAKKLEAVEQPLSVLEHAAAGTLIKEQVDALRAVYPTVWAQMRDVALEGMTSGKRVPYRQKMMLYVLTGVDPDGSLGVAVSKNQAAMAQAIDPPDMGSSGKEGLGLAKQYATPGQRKELESET